MVMSPNIKTVVLLTETRKENVAQNKIYYEDNIFHPVLLQGKQDEQTGLFAH